MNLCSITGCDNKAKTKNLCNGHYKRLLIHGNPGTTPIRFKRSSNAGLICVIDGCNLPLYRVQYCSGHYQRIQKDGDPGTATIKKSRERSKVRRSSFEQGIWDRYRLTVDNYNNIFLSQGSCCAICSSKTPKGKNWHVDHDHSCCGGRKTCGKCVRGILCNPCNIQLGIVERYLKAPTNIDNYLTKGFNSDETA